MVCFRRKNLGTPSHGLKMEIVFKRRLTNELLTTYLPSFLLLLMAYATTFFKPFYFEAAVTVNLSILLVTTTLFVRWEIFNSKCVSKINICQRHGKTSCNILCPLGGYMADLLSAYSFYWGQILKASYVVALLQSWRLLWPLLLSCTMMMTIPLIIMDLQGRLGWKRRR